MLCKKPYISKEGAAYGCGQCLPCRINKRRIWSHRIMLEALCHSQNSFLTLTIEDKNLTLVSSVATRNVHSSLDPDSLKNFLKRMRTALAPVRVRFFAVGEYGDTSFRPHYHVCLFGYQSCLRGRTVRKIGTTEPDWANCCRQCELVGRKWGLGNVDLGELNPSTASYCAEYTTKKMTKKDDARLDGRYPEFSRMSRQNGGIGSDAMWEVASSMLRFNLDERADVPSALNHGKRQLPLGRYLQGRLREMNGKEKNAPQETLDRISQEMLPVRIAARTHEEGLRGALREASEQKIADLEAKNAIYKQVRKI